MRRPVSPVVSGACWDGRLRVFLVASSSCLRAFLEDPVHPDLRWHVIDAQVAGSFGDLPVKGVAGLELEVQEPARVTPVGAVSLPESRLAAGRAALRGRPSGARVNTTSPAAWFTDSTRQPASSQALASTLPSLLPHQARCRYADLSLPRR
jgi:hypothetical protein